MPRTSRLIISDDKAISHVMSRTAVDGFPLKEVEKDFILGLIKMYSALYFTDLLKSWVFARWAFRSIC